MKSPVDKARHLGPAEDWYCRCRDHGRPVLRSASMWECSECREIAPHLEEEKTMSNGWAAKELQIMSQQIKKPVSSLLPKKGRML